MAISILNDERDGHEDHRGHRGHRKDDRDDDRDWDRGPHRGKGFAKGRGRGHHRGPPDDVFRVRGPIKLPRGGRGGPITASNTNVINVKVNVIQENDGKQKARQ
uniref:Uncharacterized protein n=1 Tax=Romanomermis culicivorax TaxID=13658 RepID=A0A915KIH6_ROMCU